MKIRSVLLVEASPLFRPAVTLIFSRISVSVTLYGHLAPVDKDCKKYDAVLLDIVIDLVHQSQKRLKKPRVLEGRDFKLLVPQLAEPDKTW